VRAEKQTLAVAFSPAHPVIDCDNEHGLIFFNAQGKRPQPFQSGHHLYDARAIDSGVVLFQWHFLAGVMFGRV